MDDREAGGAVRRGSAALRGGPIPVDPDYLRFVDRLERHPDNQDGADKTWVERAVAAYREHYRQARLVE